MDAGISRKSEWKELKDGKGSVRGEYLIRDKW